MGGSRGLLVALAAGVLLTGCSSAASSGPAPATASASASPSPDPSATAFAADAPCRVTGFVGRTRVVFTGEQLVPVYAAGLALGPGVGTRGSTELQKVVDLRPGVRVQQPEQVSVDPALLRGVGTSVVDTSTAPLPASYFIRRRVQNTSASDRLYAEYAATRVHRGRWSARVCGGPTNDGTQVTRLSGTFLSVGPFRTGVLPCEVVERRASALARQLRGACDGG